MNLYQLSNTYHISHIDIFKGDIGQVVYSLFAWLMILIGSYLGCGRIIMEVTFMPVPLQNMFYSTIFSKKNRLSEILYT